MESILWLPLRSKLGIALNLISIILWPIGILFWIVYLVLISFRLLREGKI